MIVPMALRIIAEHNPVSPKLAISSVDTQNRQLIDTAKPAIN
jgi:hypothetical protein